METSNNINRNQNKCINFRQLIEIPIFIYFFNFTLSGSVYGNLVLYKLCKLKYNETICTLLISSRDNVSSSLEEELQPQATNIIMCKSLIEGIFPALLSLFLGPWSDTNGRVPLILASSVGHLFYFILTLGYLMIDKFNPWYLLIASIPYSLSGATSSIITGSFCYVSDVTNNANRSIRMGILEGALLLGILAGSLSSPYLFNSISYMGVYGFCGIISLLNIFTTIILKESLQFNPNQEGINLFNYRLIIDMLKTCFIRRANYRRAIIWLIMLTCAANIFVLQGDSAISYLFTREKLNWKLEEYTIYTAYGILMTIIGILITAFILQKLFNIPDTVISMISYISCTSKAIIVAAANKSWHMYLGSTASSFGAISGPINRSILTKIVSTEDAGKVLSLTSSLEVIIPLLSAPIYSLLYEKTFLTYPGAFNILTATIFLLSVFAMLTVEILFRRYPSNEYTIMSINQQDEILNSEN